jgi:hypothetical protein
LLQLLKLTVIDAGGNVGYQSGWTRLHTIITVVLSVAVALVGAYVLLYNRVQPAGQEESSQELAARTSRTICRDDQLQRANSALNTNDIATLRTVAGEIRQTQDYDYDVSCVYVVLQDSIRSGDADAAVTDLRILRSMQASYGDLTRHFSPIVMTLEDLRIAVDGVRRSKSESQQSEEQVDLTEIDKRGQQ